VRRLLLVSLCLGAACARRVPPPTPPPPYTPVVPDAGSPPAEDAGTAFEGGRAEPTPAAELPAAPPDPNDPLNALYAKRLDFRHGSPLVPVRIMEGQRQVTFSPRGRMRVQVRGDIAKRVEAPAGSTWSIRLQRGDPAAIKVRIQLAEFAFADKDGLTAEQKSWEARHIPTRVATMGAVYGIAGKVVDNRRHVVLVDELLDPPAAPERQARFLRQYGLRTLLFEELTRRPSGILELLDEGGAVVAVGQDLLSVEILDGDGFDVTRVEYGVGYEPHGFEDRRYHGQLDFTVDRLGTLAVINRVLLEDLLEGLVPSEIFPKAHVEALKAQAVTARGEVLAKIGLKHLSDPYLLCAEQHCAVYKGASGEAAATSAAVKATQGEALFSHDGHLVDSVYSAVCGGHTENNEAVWGGMPNPNLRGRPDFIHGGKGLPTPADLPAFLDADLPSACRLSSLAQPSKYRWQRRFTAEEVTALAAPFGLGAVQAIAVTDRGVSGRARLLTLSGETGATQIRGELTIRRLFKNLNSAMFVVTPERGPDGHLTGWLFKGGGWGHGVGMCQTGAIGRAEAGQEYRTILRHYFSGAEVSRIY
jgi:stage II sporulation protein D